MLGQGHSQVIKMTYKYKVQPVAFFFAVKRMCPKDMKSAEETMRHNQVL